jgi:toxin ParE1/3/4
MAKQVGNARRTARPMRITYLSLAVLDLAQIRAYLGTENPEAAERIGRRLSTGLSRLQQFPNLGQPGRISGTRELYLPKIGRTSYVVVYRVKGDTVQVLRVLPSTRDIDAILEEGLPEEEN